MQLYNLEHVELVRDPLTNTKCLVAWGQDTVLVAFRGTANKENAIHDLKVRSLCRLCCAVLRCAVLCSAMLCCAVLCCAVLCCAVLRSASGAGD